MKGKAKGKGDKEVSKGVNKNEKDDSVEKKLMSKNKCFTDDNKKWLKAKLIESDEEDEEGDGEIEMDEDEGSDDEGFNEDDDSDEDSEDEMDVEKKSRFLDALKQREAEEAREEELQLNIQSDTDDFRLPADEVLGSCHEVCILKCY